ncbi:MAG TPA: cation:proton antiporter [Gemmatimonadales bacterium]
MGPHSDPVAFVALALAVILIAAKLGGHVAQRIGQPAVLGELLVGVVLGNLGLAGLNWLEPIKSDATIDILARLGVIILLFEVGLESTVREMLHVGGRAIVVGVLGVVVPWLLGWAVGAALLPDHSMYVHLFLGAVLTATSVGITARVFRDLGRSQSAEARIILGAAVIDDVLGLVILAVVAGLITAADSGTSLSLGEIGLVLAKAAVFLVGALWLGLAISPRLFAAGARLRGDSVLLAIALASCFFLSWLAAEIGLAAIVGAYAAGLILEPAHYQAFAAKGERPLEDLLRPIASFLVPVFFVVIGMRVDLAAFARADVVGLAAVLTLAAVAGKQVCGLGALGTTLDGLSIGIGMVPRGEVGLIFASLGLGLSVRGEQVIDAGLYAAVVIMVMVTTLVTPPALKWSLGRADRRSDNAP